MPDHAVLASTTLVVAGMAALSALGYAWARPIRPAMRWPLLAVTTVATVLVFITATAGSSLLHDVEASASAAEVSAAQAHGHSADGFAIAMVCLLVAVLATIWGVLRPGRERWSVGMWTGALFLAITAIATLVTGGQVLGAALHAVAVRNGA